MERKFRLQFCGRLAFTGVVGAGPYKGVSYRPDKLQFDDPRLDPFPEEW